MKEIIFQISVSGMSEEDFSDKIKIYKPFQVVKEKFLLGDCINKGIKSIKDLIDSIKQTNNKFMSVVNNYGEENFNYKTIYIMHKDYLLGLQEDKLLNEIFEYLQSDKIEIIYIIVAGGASIECSGYKFIIHSDEEIHRHKPHVHVKKDNFSPRYSLDTLERFEGDIISREYLRDEKKIIIPFLEKNKDKLLEFWNHNINGYITPVQDENGNQYYKES